MASKRKGRDLSKLPLDYWEVRLKAWCQCNGCELRISNGGHHWRLYQDHCIAQWWPATSKLSITGHNPQLVAHDVDALCDVLSVACDLSHDKTPYADKMPTPDVPDHSEPPFDEVARERPKPAAEHYSYTYIQWQDARTVADWFVLSDIEVKPATIHSIGWLLGESETAVLVGTGLWIRSGDEDQFTAALVIAKCSITKRIDLQWPEEPTPQNKDARQSA